jgi:HEAT repeat protein
VANLLTWHLAHLRTPDAVAKPLAVGRARRRLPLGLWAAVLALPAAAILGLVIWGVVSLLGPDRNNNGVQPNGRAHQGEGPRADGDVFFQRVWADLDSNDYFTRKTAVERLATMKPNDRRLEVARKLVELTTVEDVFIRRAAVTALGSWGSRDEVPALIAAIAHKDPFTRSAALQIIGRFRDPRSLEAVVASFHANSTRVDAGQALRDMGPMAEPDVLAILKNSDPKGREVFLKKAAIEVLADIGSEESEPALRQAAATGGIHLARPAQEALAAIDQRKKR